MLIEVYSSEGCVHCTTTKNLLESRGLTFIEHKVDVEISRDELRKMFPQAKMLPVVIVDGAFVQNPADLQVLLG